MSRFNDNEFVPDDDVDDYDDPDDYDELSDDDDYGDDGDDDYDDDDYDDVLEDGADLSKDQILEYLSDKVAKWQLPDDVVFIGEVPRTSVGKFSKKTLRDRYADYVLPSV